MGASRHNIWSRHLAFDLIKGGLSNDELRRRTLGFELVDNARQYDTIEWELDNADGYLTDPKRIAAGLLVRVQLGYLDQAQPWRTFLINRLRGGVGVQEHGERSSGGYHSGIGSPVDEDSAKITYSGRNRNAPDLKRSKKKNPAQMIGGKKRTFKGGASSTITGYDLLVDKKLERPRVFPAKQTSDAILEIAREVGYTAPYIDIEDTGDRVERVVIPKSMSYGQWLRNVALRLGFKYKADHDGFRFTRLKSAKDSNESIWTFDYGADDDVLHLSIDADFRLPIPRSATARGYNPVWRFTAASKVDADSAGVQDVSQILVSGSYGPSSGNAEARKNITSDDVFLTTSGDKIASPAAIKRFVTRHLRALKIQLEVVGNPEIRAGKNITLRGTGSFLDRVWHVWQAKHTFDTTTYVTTLGLEAPRGKAASSGIVKRVTGKDAKGRHSQINATYSKDFLKTYDQ